jgi:hypothetical protein
MPCRALLLKRRDDIDFAELAKLLRETFQSWRMNPVVVREENPHLQILMA